MDDNKKEKENQGSPPQAWSKNQLTGRSWRVFPEGELVAYDDGRWEVRMRSKVVWETRVDGRVNAGRGGYACGVEDTLESAKARTLAVFKAMVWILENVPLDLP